MIPTVGISPFRQAMHIRSWGSPYGLSMELTFTLYESETDRLAKPHKTTWLEWVELFKNCPKRDKKEGGSAIILGEIEENNVSRRNSDVKNIGAMGLDLDKITPENLAKVEEILTPYEYLKHSTHGHLTERKGGLPCYRIIIPFSLPVTPRQYPGVWERFNTLVGGVNDPQTKNLARLFFLPASATPETYKFHHNATGSFFDIETDLPKLKKQEVKNPDDLSVPPTTSIVEHLNLIKGISESGIDLQKAAKAVLKGEAITENRHNTMLALTWRLAFRSQCAEYVLEDFKIFERCLTASDTIPGNPTPTIETVFNQYQSACKKISSDLISRRGGEAYTTEELEQIAKKQNLASVDELKKRWLIHHKSSVYMLETGGQYGQPVEQKYAVPVIHEKLAKAPVQLYNLPKQGSTPQPKGIQELLISHGTFAESIVVDMSAQHSYYDPHKKELIEAPCPIRNFTPRYDTAFDEWLKLFAGENYETLCDWLACAPDTTKLLCALYIHGAPGAGKTLLAVGLAKLWNPDLPTDIDDVLRDFNQPLAQCPLILADEGVPKYTKGQSSTQLIRSMLTTYSRQYRRKFLANATLRGAVRLIIAANNDNVLSTPETLGPNDLQAIAQRFLFLTVPKSAAKFLESLGHRVRREWEHRTIAEHTLWLSQNRVVEIPTQNRFWVMGKDTASMTENLINNNDFVPMVLHWVGDVLTKDALKKTRNETKAQNGELFVSWKTIYDSWKLVFPDTRTEPKQNSITNALKTLSDDDKSKVLRIGTKTVRCYGIKIERVLTWIENAGEDLAEAKKNLGLVEYDGINNVVALNGLAEREPGSDDEDTSFNPASFS